MPIAPTQLPKEFNGKRYSGIYSVSESTLIARIPGVGSRSQELTSNDGAEAVAAMLLDKILTDAQTTGALR
ncbi:MAG: hypothetical protein O3A63_01925 [Proteobacteria bacterium]|nr:hypothetical protein [Pseudomonadota bacterium]